MVENKEKLPAAFPEVSHKGVRGAPPARPACAGQLLAAGAGSREAGDTHGAGRPGHPARQGWPPSSTTRPSVKPRAQLY